MTLRWPMFLRWFDLDGVGDFPEELILNSSTEVSARVRVWSSNYLLDWESDT